MSATLPLERFSAGDCFAIDPDAIERELTALWREAGKTTDNAHPVTRACLWNVAFHIEERNDHPGHGGATRQLEVVAELPRFLAARALVLRTLEASPDKPELESWISANCLLAGDGSKLVCSEEITFTSRGDGARHLPSLVRALLVPAVPTAVVFAGVPTLESPLVQGLVGASDRVIVRADFATCKDPLSDILSLLDRPGLSVMDLGWINTSAWRREVAALFDSPLSMGEADKITRAEVRAGTGHRMTARLMLGWVGSCLSSGRIEQVSPVAWRLNRPEGAPLELVLSIGDGHCLGLDLSGPDLAAPLTIEAHRDTESLDIRGIEGHMDRKPLTQRHGAAILARALSTHTHDASFLRALRLAAELK